MKKFLIAATAVFLSASASGLYAQTATSISGSQSASQSGSQSASGAQSNNSIVFGSPPSRTEADVNSVPSVFAPSITSSHPCLRGGSAGISILGGGVTGGISQIEAACMLAYLGQQEAAIRALVASSPQACRALSNVGYYVVPAPNGKTRAVAFRCGDATVQGGIYSASATAVGRRETTSTQGTLVASKTQVVAYSKCEKADGKIVFRTRNGQDSAVARSQCLQKMGH